MSNQRNYKHDPLRWSAMGQNPHFLQWNVIRSTRRKGPSGARLARSQAGYSTRNSIGHPDSLRGAGSLKLLALNMLAVCVWLWHIHSMTLPNEDECSACLITTLKHRAGEIAPIRSIYIVNVADRIQAVRIAEQHLDEGEQIAGVGFLRNRDAPLNMPAGHFAVWWDE
jgi:hypothetical protein